MAQYYSPKQDSQYFKEVQSAFASPSTNFMSKTLTNDQESRVQILEMQLKDSQERENNLKKLNEQLMQAMEFMSKKNHSSLSSQMKEQEHNQKQIQAQNDKAKLETRINELIELNKKSEQNIKYLQVQLHEKELQAQENKQELYKRLQLEKKKTDQIQEASQRIKDDFQKRYTVLIQSGLQKDQKIKCLESQINRIQTQNKHYQNMLIEPAEIIEQPLESVRVKHTHQNSSDMNKTPTPELKLQHRFKQNSEDFTSQKTKPLSQNKVLSKNYNIKSLSKIYPISSSNLKQQMELSENKQLKENINPLISESPSLVTSLHFNKSSAERLIKKPIESLDNKKSLTQQVTEPTNLGNELQKSLPSQPNYEIEKKLTSIDYLNIKQLQQQESLQNNLESVVQTERINLPNSNSLKNQLKLNVTKIPEHIKSYYHHSKYRTSLNSSNNYSTHRSQKSTRDKEIIQFK